MRQRQPGGSGATDLGVSRLSATGMGSAYTDCAGRSLDLAVVDPGTGRVRITLADVRGCGCPCRT
ncbi:MAG: hypothetical protein ACRD12_21265 [Acidimicrobiales bacterium]